jgi:2-C-methyl-D-erythritol 2,4-cyclodiphosphate synthase
MNIRVGFGYDVHPFAANRELWLGGILVKHEKGLAGHSDADVLIHALCDALLGAAGLRDIGYHFPDTADEYENIDSKILLAKTMNLLNEKGFSVGNVDCTVCAEEPKLNVYIPQMQTCLANLMQLDETDVSIKATTSEKMGFVGRKEGIAAYAVVLIYRRT